MLDRKFIMDNADAVKANCANRGVDADVDRLLELERQRRATKYNNSINWPTRRRLA
jgi:seryl-tRNA synthetase